MPDRDQVRALRLLTEALEALRRVERGDRDGKLSEDQARDLADEIDGFLHHRSEGAA